ncbi:MAG: sterol desaturase family protein [Saprospiraceae bacterium]|nr:sterol desaturase family protein [Saprospiraceae bacterium]
MQVLINIGITVAAFLAMEFVAWATHKYVMHGWLWTLHKSHHQPPEEGFFERNDFFFLIFALPGMLLMYLGMQAGFDFKFFLGLGIALYGMAYFFVHDIFIHQRIKFLRRSNNVYFRAIRKAHKVHHKHLGKEDGECFGMLIVPRKYLKEALQSSRR